MKTGYHPMAPEIGYKPMQALLESTRNFTAIFCFNDIAAIGAVRALKDAGLAVPGDVSVAGFDDIQSAAFIDSFADHRSPAAPGDGQARRAGIAGAHRKEREGLSGGDCYDSRTGDPRVHRAGSVQEKEIA